MGYWAEAGHKDALWGDSPADKVDDAIAEVVKVFERDWHRKPSKLELRRGLEFALASSELPDEPEAATCCG